MRESQAVWNARTDLHCQHYGKSPSVEHWEETCDYSADIFRSRPVDENGAIAKVGPSTPNPIGLSING
jgi:hypothetical protein